MGNAAICLLGQSQEQIEDMARNIIFGQLRLTVASLTIEEINQNRDHFLQVISSNVEPELNKIGLQLINVNVTDITDEADYIASIGKKAAAELLTALRSMLLPKKRSALSVKQKLTRTRIFRLRRTRQKLKRG